MNERLGNGGCINSCRPCALAVIGSTATLPQTLLGTLLLPPRSDPQQSSHSLQAFPVLCSAKFPSSHVVRFA
eukprot:scaffold1839_cov382-Prasinococcus_capsulatus_cf.AAC.41